MNKQTFKELVGKTYYIVSTLESADDVADDTITLAIGKLQKEQEEQESETTKEA